MIKLDKADLIEIRDASTYNTINDIVLIADVETFEILFINNFGIKQLKTADNRHEINYINKKCYELFSDTKAACENCLVKHMETNRVYRGTRFNPVVNKMLLLEDSFILYKGRVARLEIGKDISQDYLNNKKLFLSLKKEKLLNSISEKFIKDDSDILKSISFALKQTGKCFLADRSYIFLKDKDYFVNSDGWADPDRKIKNEKLPPLYIDQVKYWGDALSNGKTIIYKDIEAIKDERPNEYKRLAESSIKSLVVAPITVDKEMVGFLGVDNPRADTLANISSSLQILSNYISLGLQSDKRKQAIEYDSITSLPNYELFREKMIDILKNSKEQNYFVVKFDINRFDFINSYYGVSFGDEVLKKIGFFILNKLPKVILGTRMYSSDVFYALVHGSVISGVEHIEKLLKEDVSIFNGTMVSLSFGIYDISDKSEDFYTIMDKVSLAQIKAKKMGDNIICVYEEELRKKEQMQQQIVSLFPAALKNDEFKIYVQPIYNVKTKSVCAGEILVRWIKSGKIIPPNDFIPILENNGMIRELDHYVFTHAVQLLRKQLDAGETVVPLSVNISRITILNEQAIESIVSLIKKYDIPDGFIEVEVTESAFVEHETVLNHFVEALRSISVPVLMDDFGSGYSSLNSFKDLDISIIKLDYKFLAKGGSKFKKVKTIEAIVTLAFSLNIPLIVEGVEKPEDADFLIALGVERIQGYLFYKPMPFKDFSNLKKKNPDFSRALSSYTNMMYTQLLDVESPLNVYFNNSLVRAGIYAISKTDVKLIYKNRRLAEGLGKIYAAGLINKDGTVFLNSKNSSREIINRYIKNVIDQKSDIPPYIDYSFNTPDGPCKIRTKATLLSKNDLNSVILVEDIRLE